MPRPKPSFPEAQLGHPLAQGLVGGWPFYEGSGPTLADLSGRGNNGRLSTTADGGGLDTAPVWTAGQSGYCLQLAQSSGVFLGSSALLDPTFPKTYSAWILSTDVTQEQYWYSSDSTWSSSDLAMQFGINSSIFTAIAAGFNGNLTLLSGGTAVNNTWYQYVLTLPSSTSGTLYINAAPVATSTSLNWFGPNTGKGKVLGAINSTFGFFSRSHRGLIDGVTIYSRALSQSEIAALYEDSFQLYRRKAWRLKKATVTFTGDEDEGLRYVPVYYW